MSLRAIGSIAKDASGFQFINDIAYCVKIN